jgi:hypothetical protein
MLKLGNAKSAKVTRKTQKKKQRFFNSSYIAFFRAFRLRLAFFALPSP